MTWQEPEVTPNICSCFFLFNWLIVCN